MLKFRSAILAAVMLVTIPACSSSSVSSSATPSPSAATRTFVDDAQTSVELAGKPSRIVSTSVTLTGSLLAIDAPIIGSGGSKPNAVGLDEHGWFTHWAATAEEKGVESLYTNQKVDLEAITAAKPDLIVVSKTGGDSAMDQYEQLKSIAPTIVIDYNTADWRSVTTRLAEAVGTPDKGTKLLSDFDSKVAEAKKTMKAPTDPVDLGVYSGSNGLAVGLPTAPQAIVLKELGFTVKDTGVQAEQGRSDFAFTTKEQALQALREDTLLLIGNDDKDRQALLEDPAFAQLPAVKSGKVFALGIASFKLDYYSAIDLVEQAAKAFPS